MRKIVSHLAAALLTIAVVGAIAITLNHLLAGSQVGQRTALRRLPPAGRPAGFKAGPGRIVIGPHNGGFTDVQNLVNTLILLTLGIAVVASLAAAARRSRGSRRVGGGRSTPRKPLK